MIKVTLKDNSVLEVENGSSVLDVAKKISEGLARNMTCASVNGIVQDFRYVLEEDCTLNIYTFENDLEGKKAYWHTTSHIMAQAVKRLFPNAKLAIGPAIDNGFYYDYDVEKPFSPEDLENIEKEMANICKENLPLERFTLPRDEAIKLMKEMNEPYKVELIEDLPEGEEISFYKQGDYTDLCAGPHIASTGLVKAFKLLSSSGAYWRGDEKNKMLQRIYGISYPKKSQLDEYINMIEEAKKRDHRKLGKELDLFFFDETAPGMAYWLPKGFTMLNTLIEFWRKEHQKYGYQEFSGPQLNSSVLWKTSGHWDHYKDDMFVLTDAEEATYIGTGFPNNQSELEYNAEDQLYYYSEYGEPHLDPANDNEQLSFKNVILQKADMFTHELGDGTLDQNGYMYYQLLSSEGEGYYAVNGEMIPITWEKGDGLPTPTRYYDADGNELVLNVGMTYIAIIPSDAWNEVVIK